MNPESIERQEVNRLEKEISDPNGDKGHETRIEFADGGFIAQGSIESGPNAGKSWVKGKGATLGGHSFDKISTFGFSSGIESSSIGDWGYMTEGGQEPGQPRRGDTWLKTRTTVDHAPERTHSDEELDDLGSEPQKDAQGRIIYKKETYQDKVWILRTKYDDENGYAIMTGKHIAGPDKGKMWETRSVLKSVDGRDLEPALLPTGAVGQTEKGTIEDLVLRGISRDLDIKDTEASAMTPEERADARAQLASTVYLELAGNWKSTETNE